MGWQKWSVEASKMQKDVRKRQPSILLFWLVVVECCGQGEASDSIWTKCCFLIGILLLPSLWCVLVRVATVFVARVFLIPQYLEVFWFLFPWRPRSLFTNAEYDEEDKEADVVPFLNFRPWNDHPPGRLQVKVTHLLKLLDDLNLLVKLFECFKVTWNVCFGPCWMFCHVS